MKKFTFINLGNKKRPLRAAFECQNATG